MSPIAASAPSSAPRAAAARGGRPGGEGAGAAGPPRGALLGLAALLVLAAGLRWLGIGRDLWLDEIFTLTESVRLPLGRLFTEYGSDNQHLLYSLFAHWSVALGGESATALRLPAVVFGVASLWATWRLGRRLAGWREALLAVALLTVSYHHVWFSQNARGYTGLLLATVLATDLLLGAMESGSRRLWAAYALTLAFGMGVHLTMVFVAASHALVVAGRVVGGDGPWAAARRPLAAFVLAAGATLVLYAGMLPQLLAHFSRPAGGTTPVAMEWKSPLWLAAEAIRGLGVGLAFGVLGVVAAALLLAAGAASYLRRAPAATLAFVLPALLGAVVLLALGRNLWPRFFFNLLAFAALFAVRGCTLAGAWAGRAVAGVRSRPLLGTALALALVAGSAFTLPRNYRLPKQDFSGARDFVLEARRPGERIAAVGLAGEAYRRFHAAGRHDFAYPATAGELEALADGAPGTWVLYTLGGYLAASQPELWHTLTTDFEPVRTFPGTLGDGAVVVLHSRPGADP